MREAGSWQTASMNRITRLSAAAATFLTACQVARMETRRDLGPVLPESRDSVRVVAFGDFGYRGDGSGQQTVAKAIGKMHASRPFDLGVTLGDNFYPDGVKSDDDPVWRQIWEADYGPLKIPFFASLGNHDYRGNVQAQISYSAKSATWRMPDRYYTFRAGAALQFFALDTDEGNAGRLLFKKEWSDTQAKWLDGELGKSTAPWKIVYGHHPIFSDGHHGDEKRLQRKLLPLLRKHKAAAYLCGHEHELQFHQVDGISFVIAGGGGKDTREVIKRRAEFAASSHGFLEIEASRQALMLRLRGVEGQVLFERAMKR